MTNPPNSPKETASPSDVVRQVFEEFAVALKNANATPEVVERLRVLLLSDKSLNEKVVAEAMFPEAPTL